MALAARQYYYRSLGTPYTINICTLRRKGKRILTNISSSRILKNYETLVWQPLEIMTFESDIVLIIKPDE